MKKLFDPVALGQLKLKNRLIRSATFERGAAEDGVITDKLGEIYADLAEGGVGLIITGQMGVGPNSCLTSAMTAIYRDEFLPEFRAIAELVHQRDSKIVVQLNHCGVKAGIIDQGDLPWGPTASRMVSDKPARAMSIEDIGNVTNDFAQAALKCKTAGADGVQIHAAHGYLLSQFLNPQYNTRQDQYGGSIENRARFLLEVYDAVRAQVGPNYPVILKINYHDLEEPSITGEECRWVCQELDRRGIDAIELSAGLVSSIKSGPSRRIIHEEDEGSFAAWAVELSATINVPVISVGGFRTPAIAEHWLNKGNIAAISLCRPLIREPGLVRRWQSGDLSKAQCISCNKCYMPKDGLLGCQQL